MKNSTINYFKTGSFATAYFRLSGYMGKGDVNAWCLEKEKMVENKGFSSGITERKIRILKFLYVDAWRFRYEYVQYEAEKSNDLCVSDTGRGNGRNADDRGVHDSDCRTGSQRGGQPDHGADQ